MALKKLLNILKDSEHKIALLYRFHVTVIMVNVLAAATDLLLQRYQNALIEVLAAAALTLGLWRLHALRRVEEAAYLFLGITSAALFAIIYLNHFATMSVVFVLLLPLTTLLFIRLRNTLLIALAFMAVLGGLLYLEHLHNPSNMLVQNPEALFNLAYAAGIIYLFGILYHLSILKTFDELDASNRQKELLLGEVHHRVKNNLNVIASIIGLQANALGAGEKEQLLKSKSRIESIAMVHEMLYRCDDFESIGFKTYMDRLAGLLLGMYSRSGSVAVHVRSDVEHMPLHAMIQLGIIANELLTNSLKYAFEEKEGRVDIELSEADGRFTFRYHDDGIGIAQTHRLGEGTSLGIKLVRLAAKQLEADIQIISEGGLTFLIGFDHA